MAASRAAGDFASRFAEHAARLPWLHHLFTAYDILDAGLATAAAAETRRRGVASPCGQGCDHCCRHQVVPVTPLEIAGLTWFAVEMTEGAGREVLAATLDNPDPETCPFLAADGRCAVYPMRPMACRKFRVFGARCEEREDVYRTRRHDLLTPPRRASREAFAATLPYYGITVPAERQAALDGDFFVTLATGLYTTDWRGVAALMRAHRG